MRPLLLVDIGNTSVTVAAFRADRPGRPLRLPTAATSGSAAQELIRRMSPRGGFGGAVLSSVVPARTGSWRKAIAGETGIRPLVVSHTLDFGIRIDYRRAETIGADRLVNACAAFRRYGAPVVAIDAGTATTFDVVDRTGAFVGGVIAPGPRMMLDYLADRTALLPRLTLPSGVSRAVGRSTREAMEIGARTGYTGLVRELVASLRRELGRGTRFCATGGDGAWAVEGLGIPYEPALTLFGLAEVWRLNREVKRA